MNSVHVESKSLLFPSEDPIQLKGPFHLQNSKFYKCEQSAPTNESFRLYSEWVLFGLQDFVSFLFFVFEENYFLDVASWLHQVWNGK